MAISDSKSKCLSFCLRWKNICLYHFDLFMKLNFESVHLWTLSMLIIQNMEIMPMPMRYVLPLEYLNRLVCKCSLTHR